MRVLLVDDSVTMRTIEKEHLRELGVTDTEEAGDGAAGFEILEKSMPVDVILLDINMPTSDGLAMLKRVRDDSRFDTVRIVMVTSDAEKERVLAAVRAGANDYLVKPFTQQEFARRFA